MVQNEINHLHNFRHSGRPQGSPLQGANRRGDLYGRPKSVKIVLPKMNHAQFPKHGSKLWTGTKGAIVNNFVVSGIAIPETCRLKTRS